jgi:aspartokinase/homoserine dehydrogenase 1
MKKWTVHSFEGDFCCTAGGMSLVLEVLRQYGDGPICAVISPRKDLPPALLSLVDQAVVRDESLWGEMEQLSHEFTRLIEDIVPAGYRQELEAAIREDFQNIEDILRAVWLVRDSSSRTREYISGLGAVWTARMFGSRLRAEGYNSAWLDTRSVIVIRQTKYGPEVQWDTSRASLEREFSSFPTLGGGTPSIMVTTGGLGRTIEGAAASLGKDGTELTASVLGNLLDAAEITLWKGVDGVMSADPEMVPGSVVIPELTYQEATELAYFGAEVLHPQAMSPAIMKGIPLRIRNVNAPDRPGTLIAAKVRFSEGKPVKGFSIIHDVSLLNIEGAGMIGVPGVSSRLFTALRQKNISVILISQASSEHSICCAVPAHQGQGAKETAREAFAEELASFRINSIDVEEGCAILAAVGDQMSGIPGISAKFFGALGKAGVNVRAIAQGSSERNISAVINEKDASRALRAVHAGFYLSNQTLSIGIIGPGKIGSTLLDQIAGESERLKNSFNIDLRVRAITDSKKMTLAKTGIDIVDWKKALAERSEPTRLEAFIEHVAAEYFPHSVVIDCTTSADIPSHYAEWLHRGIHIITPNKKGGTSPMSEYRRIMEEARTRQRHFLYETTVGAGLPIIGTLRDLIQTGDKIHRIEGIFSGTLAYLFWKFDGSRPFSSLVEEAKELGYTEPDPRDDLSGMDILRKTVILAREVGWAVEVEDVPVFSLVPEELKDGSVEDFLKGLPVMDGRMEELLAEAEREGAVLKYAGIIEADGSCRVELMKYPKDHAFARITGSDNIVAFTTDRYEAQPLVVQGPGAGPEVTAGGVFADLLRLASYLGAKI